MVTLQVLRLVTMVLAAGMIPKIIGALQRRQAPETEPMVVESRSLSTTAVS